MTGTLEDRGSPAGRSERDAVRHDLDDTAEHDDYRFQVAGALEPLARGEIGHGQSDEVAILVGSDKDVVQDSPSNTPVTCPDQRACVRLGWPSVLM
jgi:hypothetical protein